MFPLRLFVLLLFAAAEVSLSPRTPVLRLAVTGDTGKGADAVARGITRLHRQTPFDAIVLTGDNFYPCGVTSETDPRWSLVTAPTRIGPPVLPVLGNHDFCGQADPDAQIRATGKIANWRFPARQYAVRTPLADFAFLDTTPYARAGSSPVPPIKLRMSTIFPDEIRRERIGFAVVEISETKVRVRFHDGDGRPRGGWIDARSRPRPAPSSSTRRPTS